MDISVLEWIGYAASVLVLISMLMSSVLRLRLINLTGSALFSAYGFFIDALPVALLNLCVVFANIYHLYKMFRINDSFSSLEIKKDNRYLVEFLRFHLKDIQKIFVDFEYINERNLYSFLILRNMAVAGVFLARKYQDNILYIGLDYVVQEYRDLKPGRFIYKEKAAFFKEQGYTKLVTEPKTKQHKKYLLQMGFAVEEINGDTLFALNI